MERAISKARQMAARTGDTIYVVFDKGGSDDYEVATDYDMDTWFLGLEPMAAVEPNGEVTTWNHAG